MREQRAHRTRMTIETDSCLSAGGDQNDKIDPDFHRDDSEKS